MKYKIIIFTLIALTAISFVISYDPSYTYTLLCLSKGESANLTAPQSYVCQTTSCPNFCVYDTPSGKRYSTDSSICFALGLSCEPGGTGSMDVTPPTLTLIDPIPNAVYNSRSVLFNLTLDEKGEVSYYDNINGQGRWSTLFSERNSYSKKLSMKEGLNDLTLSARDEDGNEANKTIKFYVDSKAPKIKKTYPKKGTYATGEFTVEYTEENLQSVTLVINGVNVQKKIDCPSSSKKASCIFNVDLTQYDGQEINYTFVLEDLLTTSTLKTPVAVKVDITNPNLAVFDPDDGAVYNKYVPFNMQSSETVKLQYRDNSALRPTWKTLCSKCTVYNKVISFGRGTHNVDIQATDLAGNPTGYNYDFTVSY
ncbi:MAG: hypothetical protein PHE43_01060 [Candidatus Nanoarchaeia archaeon]|nr:hypothetical protein [Candidatus Nanoarchaeia archaeon]